MRLAAISAASAASLLCASCQRSAIEPSQSLVGAKRLPSAQVLSRETILINRGFGTLTPGHLTYELRPDDALAVTFYAKDWATVLASELFHLPSRNAAEARQKLWRLRPATLRGIEWEKAPAECPPPPTDTFPETTVAFIAEGPKPGVEDDHIGLTGLPNPSICNTRGAAEARALVGDVLRSLPTSKVAIDFDRRLRLAQAKLDQSVTRP